MATAAKKPVQKSTGSGDKKPTAKAAASALKPAPAEAKTAAGKMKPPSAAVKAAPSSVKPKAAVPTDPGAKPAARKPEAAAQPEPKKPNKTMKTDDTKTSTAKPAMAKPAPAKPAKAGKKITGVPQNDAELLAMPESDYMGAAQLAYFKDKLTAMRDEILENARETGEHLKENEVFADPNDRATVEEENLLEQRVRDRERKLLKKINTALVRIEAGEYGYCLETGDPIGLPRLLARPTAELSIEAQEKHERLEKLYAD